MTDPEHSMITILESDIVSRVLKEVPRIPSERGPRRTHKCSGMLLELVADSNRPGPSAPGPLVQISEKHTVHLIATVSSDEAVGCSAVVDIGICPVRDFDNGQLFFYHTFRFKRCCALAPARLPADHVQAIVDVFCNTVTGGNWIFTER